jgi:hypothetical protein
LGYRLLAEVCRNVQGRKSRSGGIRIGGAVRADGGCRQRKLTSRLGIGGLRDAG